MTMEQTRGLTQVYTGDGKGKTTAALGQTIRAVGHGRKVVIIQFIKGDSLYGEHLFAKKYHHFKIVQLNTKNSFNMSLEELRLTTVQTLALAEKTIVSGVYDMVVLDEIMVALNKGLINAGQVLDLIAKKPEKMELILTGRGAPKEIIEKADLVTEMVEVKHPFAKGVTVRRGIEY
jgi:cob(I)alamin adenosyltransferase